MVHNLKESKEICRKAIDKYGETAQIYLAMVEARYLAQALQRYLDCRREGAGEDKLEEALVLQRSKRAKVKQMLTGRTGGAVQDGGDCQNPKRLRF